MECLSFDWKSKTLSLKKEDIPKPAENEILMKVAYSGICGTDLHILGGNFPCKEDAPFIPGHEFVGTIEAIGFGVKAFKVGDKVAVDPNVGCNFCKYCHSGNNHQCSGGGVLKTLGIFRNGGWATHALVPEAQAHRIPNGLEMTHAALSEPLSCLAHGWDIVNPVHVGSNVLLIGAGIIGLLWASILHLHGLRKTVTVSEPQENRREIVKKLGLDYKVKNPSDFNKSDEFDLAIDCSGSGPAIESAINLLGPGGRLCIFGIANPKTKVSVEPFQIYKKELKILGINRNPYSFPKALCLVEAMADKYLSYEKLGIKVYKLSEYREALAALKSGDISKALFKL